MAEQEFNPVQEGQRIAHEYLSKRGWALEWRRTVNSQLYPGFQREEFEAKQKQCDQMEEDAEALFSREVERWRRDPSPQARQVLETIVAVVGKRLDLGFFAKRIIDRLKRDLGPL
jgi:hypothetical protein